EGGDRGGDGVLADGGPDVAGAAVHVAGVALAPRAHVVGVALSRAPPRAGRSSHPPPALRAAPRSRREQRSRSGRDSPCWGGTRVSCGCFTSMAGYGSSMST